ncbi:hypothetical protein FOL47_005093, partial [Perkinsus chesapeaki]
SLEVSRLLGGVQAPLEEQQPHSHSSAPEPLPHHAAQEDPAVALATEEALLRDAASISRQVGDLPTTFGLPTTDGGLPTADGGLPTTGGGLPTTFGLPTAEEEELCGLTHGSGCVVSAMRRRMGRLVTGSIREGGGVPVTPR